jgi:hypothetical protein
MAKRHDDNEYAITPGFWDSPNVKMGAPPLFDTAESLWDAAKQYFKWCDDNPIRVKDWVGKDADQVDRIKPTPYSLAGFAIFIGASRNWFKEFRIARKEQNDTDILAVCARIEDICFTQQYNGAVAGVFQWGMVARALGIADKQETTLNGAVPVVWNEEKSYEAKQKTD